MGIHVLSNGESSLQVSLEERVLGLDVLGENLVELYLDLLLSVDVVGVFLGLGVALGEESLSVDLLSLGAEFLEVSLGDLVESESVERDLGGGGYAVRLVDSSEGDSVELVRAGDEEEAGVELLEEDDSSALESSGEDDENSSWSDRVSEFGDFGFLVRLDDSLLNIIGRVHLSSSHRL